jgi:hypothetical protein
MAVHFLYKGDFCMHDRDSSFSWGVFFFISTIVLLSILAIFLYTKSVKVDNQDNQTTSDTTQSEQVSPNVADYQQCIQDARTRAGLVLSDNGGGQENADVNACKAQYGM